MESTKYEVHGVQTIACNCINNEEVIYTKPFDALLYNLYG